MPVVAFHQPETHQSRLVENLDEGQVLGKVLLRVVVRLGARWAVLLARVHGELLDVPVENLGYACRLRLVGRQSVHGIPQAVGLRLGRSGATPEHRKGAGGKRETFSETVGTERTQDKDGSEENDTVPYSPKTHQHNDSTQGSTYRVQRAWGWFVFMGLLYIAQTTVKGAEARFPRLIQ